MVQSGFTKGEIIVASHNSDTIDETLKIANQSEMKIRLSYAQLLGLADHLTIKMNSEGYRVYKLLPWAETKVMIPYMIRRG